MTKGGWFRRTRARPPRQDRNHLLARLTLRGSPHRYAGHVCKSPKLPGDKFQAVRQSNRRPPICVLSITLPRSPREFIVRQRGPPHLHTKVVSTAREFLIISTKRLLQQYLPGGDIRLWHSTTTPSRFSHGTMVRNHGQDYLSQTSNGTGARPAHDIVPS